MIIVESSVELVSPEHVIPMPAKFIELVGRTAYKSHDKMTPDTSNAFVQKLTALQHTAVLECSLVAFRIITDRGITHELVRHRIGVGFVQESTRYCDYSKQGLTVVEPSGLEVCGRGKGAVPGDHALGNCRCCAYHMWLHSVLQAERAYYDLSASVSAQIARSVLPTCVKAEICMWGNFTAWLHFIKLRTSTRAHPDMQRVARPIANYLHEYCPAVFVKSFATNGASDE